MRRIRPIGVVVLALSLGLATGCASLDEPLATGADHAVTTAG